MRFLVHKPGGALFAWRSILAPAVVVEVLRNVLQKFNQWEHQFSLVLLEARELERIYEASLWFFHRLLDVYVDIEENGQDQLPVGTKLGVDDLHLRCISGIVDSVFTL